MEAKYVLIDVTSSTRKILEEIETSRALFEVYEGGVVRSLSTSPGVSGNRHGHFLF